VALPGSPWGIRWVFGGFTAQGTYWLKLGLLFESLIGLNLLVLGASASASALWPIPDLGDLARMAFIFSILALPPTALLGTILGWMAVANLRYGAWEWGAEHVAALEQGRRLKWAAFGLAGFVAGLLVLSELLVHEFHRYQSTLGPEVFLPVATAIVWTLRSTLRGQMYRRFLGALVSGKEKRLLTLSPHLILVLGILSTVGVAAFATSSISKTNDTIPTFALALSPVAVPMAAAPVFSLLTWIAVRSEGRVGAHRVAVAVPPPPPLGVFPQPPIGQLSARREQGCTYCRRALPPGVKVCVYCGRNLRA